MKATFWRKIGSTALLLALLFSILPVNHPTPIFAQDNSTRIAYGQTLTGITIDLDNPVVYLFSGQAGDEVVIESSSSSVDTYLILADSTADTLYAENDDISAQNLDARIEFTLPANADYLIGVFGYSSGPFSITLSVTGGPSAAPTPTDGANQLIQYGQTVTGNAIDIETPVVYTFTGSAGDVVSIELSSGTVDTVVVLADSNGNTLVENDDISRTNLNSHVSFSLPANGEYLIGAFAYTAGSFSLTLNLEAGSAPNVNVNNQQPTGDVFTGVIDDSNHYAEIPLNNVSAGATITIDLRATSGDLDTYVGLLLGDTVIAENDDRENGNTNSYLEYTQAQAGDYTIIVTRYSFETGRTSGAYELVVDVVQSTTVVVPVDPNTTINPVANGYPAMNNTQIADWTILAYLGGDNNLEASMLADLNEFELAGGSNQSVRVVAFIDRSGDYDDSNGDWAGVRIYEVSPDTSGDDGGWNTPTIDSIPLADLGQLDSGYGNNLADFLVWGITNFPARHYALEINNHGAAWVGTVTDDTAEQILLLPELKEAFAIAAQTANGKLDLIINDACLMSSVEYLAIVAPYFNYALTSAEIQLVPGFDMTLLTNTLKQNPEIAMQDLGKLMIDKYFEDIDNTGPEDYLTANFTDLSKFSAMLNTLEGFTQIVNLNSTAYATLLGQSRSNAYTYSTWSDDGNEYIDLGNFMAEIIQNTRDIQLSNSAQAVIDALDAQLMYSVGGSYVEQLIMHYNIYFPERSADYITAYANLSPVTSWADLLSGYYNNVGTSRKATNSDFFGLPLLARSVVPQVTITNVYPAEASISTPVNVYMEVVGRNISQGNFTVDQIQADGTVVRLKSSKILTLVIKDSVASYINSWEAGVDESVFNWEVTLPIVTDGIVSYNELITHTSDISSLEGRYRFPNSTLWQDVTVIFNDEGRADSIISTSSSGAVANITISEGGEFQAYRSVVTADGRIVRELGNLYTWPADGLTWQNAPAPSGEYNLGFLVEAFGGATGFDSVKVNVNNDQVNSDLRGYVDLDWGFQFLQPTEWFDTTYFPAEDWLQANNVEESAYIFVYPVYESDGNLQNIAQDALDRFDLNFNGQFTPITVAGGEGLEFAYDYWVDNTQFVARAFAVYRPDQELGLVFAVETSDNTTDSIYETLTNSLSYFDQFSVREQDLGSWQREWVDDDVRIPVRRDWLEGLDVDIWLSYSPNADVSSPTFARLTSIPNEDLESLLLDMLNLTVSANEGYQLISQETYYGENQTWESATYSYLANGQTINGRLHVTFVEALDTAYVFWFEAPELESREVFASTFEPMLDGFKYIPPQN